MVVMAVLVTTAVTVSVSLYIMKRDLKNLIGEQQYSALKSISVAIDDSFYNRRVALRALAQGLPSTAITHPEQLQEYVGVHSSLTEIFTNFLVIRPDGELLANYVNTSVVGKMNFADREYMQRTLKERQGVISIPFLSRIVDRPVIAMTEPVFDAQGNVVLVFVGSIDLQQDSFVSHYSSLRFGKSGFMFILTPDGTIINHPNPARLLQRVDPQANASIAINRALAGFEGNTEGITREGDAALFSFTRIQGVDWIIGSVFLEREALQSIREMQRQALLVTLALAIVAGLLAWIIMSRLLNPLRRLHRHIQKIHAAKVYDEVPLYYRQDEIGDLGSAFNALMRERRDAEVELEQARAHLESMNKTLERLALEDDLTGLANRRRFDLALQEEFSRAMRTAQPLALVMIDVDHFKQFNDLYGHLSGDDCLYKVGRAIRAQQSRPGDVMARYGGEEMAVLLPGADLLGALAVAERIRLAVRQRGIVHAGNPGGIITVSAGVAAIIPERDLDEPDKLLGLADRALYLAKQQGRDRVCSTQDLPLL